MSNQEKRRSVLPNLSEVHVLLTPATLWYLVFLLAPVGLMFVYSFLTYSNFSVEWAFSLEAWTGTFTSATFEILSGTLLTGLLVCLLTLLFGYPVAYYMRFYLSELQGLFVLLFLVIVFWTSEIIRMIAWYPILNQNGFINIVLMDLGLIGKPLEFLLYSQFATIVGYLQNYVLFMAAPIYIAMSRIDEDLLEASATLRAKPRETFRYVVWPQSKPGIVIGFIFVFVMTIADTLVPQYLGSGGGTMSSTILSHINQTLNYPAAAADSFLLLASIFFVIYVATRWVDITDLYEV